MSHVFTFLLVSLFSLWSNSGNAKADIKAAYFRGNMVPFKIEFLRNATSAQEFFERRARIANLERLRGICSLELEKGIAPLHCFRLLQIERQVDLLETDGWNDSVKLLNDLCDSPQKMRNVPRLRTDEWAAVSPSCLASATQAQNRNRYISAEERPLDRFAQRQMSQKFRTKPVFFRTQLNNPR